MEWKGSSLGLHGKNGKAKEKHWAQMCKAKYMSREKEKKRIKAWRWAQWKRKREEAGNEWNWWQRESLNLNLFIDEIVLLTQEFCDPEKPIFLDSPTSLQALEKSFWWHLHVVILIVWDEMQFCFMWLVNNKELECYLKHFSDWVKHLLGEIF